MRRRAARRPAARDAVLVLLAALLGGLTILQEVGPHDEGLVLQAGLRLADGQLPYRDFWWNYGPGLAVLQGGVAALTGPSLLAWRVVRVVVGAVGALLAFKLARREGASGRWALVAWVAAAGALAWPLTPGPTAYGLTASLGALLVDDRRAAGGLAAVAAWFRPELGVAAALGAGRRAWPWAAVATLLLYAPFVLPDPGAFWDDVVRFTTIQDLQRLPIPADLSADPNKLLEGTIVVVVLAGAALALVSKPPLRLLPLLVAGVGYLLARADEFHLVPLAVVVAVLLARAQGRVRAVTAAIVLGVIALHGLDRQAGRVLHPGDLAAVPGRAGDGVRTGARDAAALAQLVRRVPPGPVFVAPPRFDRVRFGAPLVNVVLNRRNPTRYDVMQPGVVTTRRVQREILRDLRRSNAVVVRWLAPAARVREPNGSGRSSGVMLLDDALRREWRPVFRTGDYLVLVPRAR